MVSSSYPRAEEVRQGINNSDLGKISDQQLLGSEQLFLLSNVDWLCDSHIPGIPERKTWYISLQYAHYGIYYCHISNYE